MLHQLAEVIGLSRKLFADFSFENREIVREAQPLVWKGDFAGFLRTESQLVILDAKLAQQFVQWRAADIARNIIGHRVQADIEFASVELVKRIQAARHIM